MPRRNAMNAILVGAVGVSALGLAVPYISFFLPPGFGQGGGGGGVIAKDALGADATVLILDENKVMADFALNAVCTHLGCVVPWNKAENKFMCPCHGSQYNKEGKVVRGPAPLSLALAHREQDETGKVLLRTWTETDFRTGEAPWWK